METTTGLSSIDTRETANLIGSDKVEGTAVYASDGSKIGSIQRVMIDKVSGKVAYAVMSFGGFLGMGEDYYPVPWSMLNNDTSLEGYRTNLTKEQIERAPKYSASTGWNGIARMTGAYTTITEPDPIGVGNRSSAHTLTTMRLSCVAPGPVLHFQDVMHATAYQEGSPMDSFFHYHFRSVIKLLS